MREPNRAVQRLHGFWSCGPPTQTAAALAHRGQCEKERHEDTHAKGVLSTRLLDGPPTRWPCNEADRGDMGLETLKSRRDKAKLKWWYKLASMSVRRCPRQLFVQEWKVKPRTGRQRKPWNKHVDELFDVLGLPKGELLDDIRKGQCPLSLFLLNVNESVSNSESKKYVEGLNSKVKLELYKTFGKENMF